MAVHQVKVEATGPPLKAEAANHLQEVEHQHPPKDLEVRNHLQEVNHGNIFKYVF